MLLKFATCFWSEFGFIKIARLNSTYFPVFATYNFSLIKLCLQTLYWICACTHWVGFGNVRGLGVESHGRGICRATQLDELQLVPEY